MRAPAAVGIFAKGSFSIAFRLLFRYAKTMKIPPSEDSVLPLSIAEGSRR
jgi:hypothetical protein